MTEQKGVMYMHNGKFVVTGGRPFDYPGCRIAVIRNGIVRKLTYTGGIPVLNWFNRKIRNLEWVVAEEGGGKNVLGLDRRQIKKLADYRSLMKALSYSNIKCSYVIGGRNIEITQIGSGDYYNG